MHEQPRRRRLAAARFADDAERLAFHHLEIDAVDGAHDGFGAAEHGLADGEVLDEPAHREQRLGGTAAVARDEGGNGAQFFTSMAERSPSENKLKEIEVMKMTRPGRAAIQGCT